MLKRILLPFALAACLHAFPASGEEALPPVEVFVPGLCLACIDWADHLRQNGFSVTLTEAPDMAALKRRLGVPKEMESVHTARVGGYFVEGHVPAEDIKLLLREKPKARGLAVPGLPMGAPGREATGADFSCESGCTMLERGAAERPPRREMYNTLLVAPDGSASVYARH